MHPQPAPEAETATTSSPDAGPNGRPGTVPSAPSPVPTVPPAPPGRQSATIPIPIKVASELSARFLLIVAAAGVLLYLVGRIWVVAIPVAIALLFSALLAPAVAAAVRVLKIPRGAATGLVLVGGLALFGLVISFVVNAFIAGLPDLLSQLELSYRITIRPLLAGPPLHIPLVRLDNLSEAIQRSISENISVITSGALSTAATVGELVSGALLLLFVLIFFLLDGRNIWRFLLRAVPAAQRTKVDTAGRRGFASLVGYTRATVAVAFVDALGLGIGLWLIKVPLVVPLAALVFLGAFVPVIGAVVSGSVAVLVALVANGPIPAVIVLGVLIAVMQLESHILQPLLLGRAVALHPLAVVLGVAGGLVVAGIVGALLAVPLIAVMTAGVRSLLSPDEPRPEAIDPLNPDHGAAGPTNPRRWRLLIGLASKIVRRRRPKR